jgi:hypothetical protein
MQRKRVLALVLTAVAFLGVGLVYLPEASASESQAITFPSLLITVKGDITPFQGVDGTFLPEYSNQTTLTLWRGRVVAVSTAALHCDQSFTSCVVDTPPSMWSDAVRGLDPQAPAAIRRPGGIDALNYDDRGGAGEAKARVLDMYRRSLRSALAKAGL